MNFSLPTAIVGAFFGSLILAGALLYLWRTFRSPPGLGWWTASFAMNTLRLGVIFFMPLLGQHHVTFLSESLQAVGAVFLLVGTMAFIGRSVSYLSTFVFSMGLVAWAGVFTYIDNDFLLRTFPLYLIGGSAMIYTGITFWREGRLYPEHNYRPVALAFVLWGVHKMDYPFVRPLTIEWIPAVGFTLAHILSTFVAISLVIVALRRSRDFAEAEVAKARQLSDHDSLTGLPNRHYANLLIENALTDADEQGMKVAMVEVDLLRFAEVNEAFGHDAGDLILRDVAKRLRAAVGSGDVLARISGDNFIVLRRSRELPGDAAVLANQIQKCMTEAFKLDEQQVRLGCSIGIAIYPDDGQSVSDMLQATSTAVDQAKRSGGHASMFFKECRSHDARSRLALRSDMHTAVSRGELELYYQPLVDLSNGKLVGAEALMRWNHPVHGLMMPARFIPEAEASTMIIPMGRWALLEACSANHRWIDQGLDPLPIWVNISAKQFHDPKFRVHVEEALDYSGLSPEYLGLELTETMFLDASQEEIHRLESLKRLGVRLALDDFGTGYSNLSQLRTLPVDKLKVDMSFIRNVPGNVADETMVRGIIRLGQSIGMTVVMEGIETEEQEAFLIKEDCDQAQGYLFGRPMPDADYTSYRWDRSKTPASNEIDEDVAFTIFKQQ